MPIRLHRLSEYAFVLLLLTAVPVHAALNIEIFGGGATQIPIQTSRHLYAHYAAAVCVDAEVPKPTLSSKMAGTAATGPANDR